MLQFFRNFVVKIPRPCPNACRLRGLPQSVPREFYLILASNISLQNSHIKLLLTSPRACRSHKTVVSALGRGIFLTQFVLASSHAFRLHRLAQNGCPDLGSQHFSLEFSRRIKVAFARCPCAFRLCRLTQDACPGPDAQSFPCKFLDMALVTVRFDSKWLSQFLPVAFVLCILA